MEGPRGRVQLLKNILQAGVEAYYLSNLEHKAENFIRGRKKEQSGKSEITAVRGLLRRVST